MPAQRSFTQLARSGEHVRVVFFKSRTQGHSFEELVLMALSSLMVVGARWKSIILKLYLFLFTKEGCGGVE